MPIYEYVCRACGQEVERLQKLSDAPLTDCPDCGRPDLARKLSAPSFRLKGGGWYETDFKGDKEKKRNIAGDSGSGEAKTDKTDKKTEPKTETTAAKAEPKAGTTKAAESKPVASSPPKTNSP